LCIEAKQTFLKGLPLSLSRGNLYRLVYRRPERFGLAAKREFTLDNEYHYNHRGPAHWITSHVVRYPIFPLLVLLAAIVNNGLASYVQVYIGRGFDLVTSPNFTVAALLALALAVLGVTVGQGVTGFARNAAVEFLAQRIERDSREELYVSLLGKSQTFHGRQRVGDIMARATNDVRALNYMFSPGLGLIVDSAMGVVVPMVIIGRINPRLLLVPSLFLVVLAVTIYDYNRRLGPVSEGLRNQFGTMNAGLEEAIAGIEVVKANVQEHYEWNKFVHDASVFRDYYVKQGIIQARYLPWLVFGVAWGAGLLDALLIWRSGAITLGQVVTYMGLLGALRFPTFISIFTFNLVQMGLAGARRILEIINTETDLDENQAGGSQRIAGDVAFEHVSFGYDGKLVLNDISFTAHAGETVAIVGLTGSGKTTLTRLINRIFDVDTGRVLVDGIDVRDWSLEALRSQISTIEQDVFLFSRTLAENIAFGCVGASQADIDTAAQAAQARDFIMSFPEGYQTTVGERGVTLSGGQRQRIAIARAFLTDPRILILDDSTSAIDSATEDQIQRAMRHISQERTTFLITHRLSQIRWADRILLLRRGELVDQGTHEELMARSTDYRRIFVR
jgi:ATP-binding cassette, subfamily B, bacterial